MTVVRVYPENIAPIWPQVSQLFAKIIEARPTHTTEDVRLLLMGGAAQLWAQWQEPNVEAAIVTEFASYPRGCWLRVWLDGAKPGVKQDHEAFYAALERWRAQHGCRGFEVIGRSGWARLFPAAVVEGIVMRWTM